MQTSTWWTPSSVRDTLRAWVWAALTGSDVDPPPFPEHTATRTALARWIRWHGLVQRVYPIVRGRPPTSEWAWLADALRGVYYRGVVWNLHLLETLRVVETFARSRSISWIHWKGLTLAVLAYGDTLARMPGDLDVWIPPEHPPEQLAEQLATIGYRPLYVLSPSEWRLYRRAMHAIVFLHDTWCPLDVHWRWMPPDFQTREMTVAVGATIPIRIPCATGDVTVQTLSPEWHFLYHMLHAAKHEWAKLLWTTDLAGIVYRHPALDWDLILREIHRHRMVYIAGITLRLIREWTDLPLPPEPRRLLETVPSTAGVFRRVQRRILDMRGEGPVWQRLALMWRIRESWRDRLRILWGWWTTPMPADLHAWRLPTVLHPLYPWLRPVRLVGKALVMTARAIGTATSRRPGVSAGSIAERSPEPGV